MPSLVLTLSPLRDVLTTGSSSAAPGMPASRLANASATAPASDTIPCRPAASSSWCSTASETAKGGMCPAPVPDPALADSATAFAVPSCCGRLSEKLLLSPTVSAAKRDLEAGLGVMLSVIPAASSAKGDLAWVFLGVIASLMWERKFATLAPVPGTGSMAGSAPCLSSAAFLASKCLLTRAYSFSSLGLWSMESSKPPSWVMAMARESPAHAVLA
mmetsp:Transcript_6317/g.21754  ORF Transcript_6317/g.21754 Transcript_6317/m.21754 type:complete len:216 (+) Transcript_6317:647-1294(+)